MRSMQVVVVVAAATSWAHAGNPLDKPAFTATPQELLAAAKTATVTERGGVVLRQDTDDSFDDRARLASRTHVIVFVATDDEAQEWSTVWADWRPWSEERPKVRARTISASGQVHELDPAALVEEADRVGEGRHLRADRVLAAGSIVEEEITRVDRDPAPGGRALTYGLNGYLPVMNVRLTVSAPAALKATVVPRGLPKTAKVQHAVTAGRATWSYDLSNIPGDETESAIPAGVYPIPMVHVTVARSWADVARAYAGAIAPKLSVPLPAELHAGDTLDNARAVTAWFHQHVQYSGVDFVHAPIDAANLDATLKRGTGNASEVGLLLAALLRAAGIKAEVVLVDRGPLHGSDRDAPSLMAFDHLLVRTTIGGVETWIDPEDPEIPVGQLRADDQGRAALATTAAALIDTPRAPATANLIHETRTYQLLDLGFGTLTETSTETGVFDVDRRHWLRKTTDADARKQWAEYMTDRYGADLDRLTYTSVDDLTKPVELTLIASHVHRANTAWDHAGIYLNPGHVTARLPWTLRDAKAKDRVVDLAIATPQVYEIENRLVIPAGYELPAPAAEQKRALGAATFIERQRVDGHTFVVTYRLELTKTRLTAAETNETRKAVLALLDESRHLVFQHEAWSLVAHGKFREGVAKMTETLKAQPAAAREHARFAQMLINVGDGEGARREGRKAVELAPKDAEAHLALGWVLEHDLVGQRWAPGHDHAGARKELELAHSLDPKHAGAALELAYVLERGTRGAMFGTGTDLHAAVEAWRAANELDPSKDHATGVLRTLLWSGDAASAEKEALKLEASTERDTMLLAARAITHGADVALRDLQTDNRTLVLQGAGGVLMLVRQYDLARRIFAEAGSVPGNQSQQDMLAKLQRFDWKTKSSADPEGAAFEIAAEEIEPGAAGAIYWDTTTAGEIRGELRKISLPKGTQLMSPAVMGDVVHAIMKVKVDGDANAWRVEFEFNGKKDVVYMAADRGVPKVIGMPSAPAGIGRHLLRLLGKHDDVAIRLLDWALVDRVQHATLSRVWGGTFPQDTVHLTLAASLLAEEPDHEISAGTACGMSTTDGQLVCDTMVAHGMRVRHKWAELEAFAATWVARAPANALPFAISQRALALSHLGRLDEAEKLVGDALATNPDDVELLAIHANIAAVRGQTEEAGKREDAVVQARPTNARLLNNAAWLKYLLGVDLAGAREQAHRAVELEPKAGNIANTAAALDAESGDLAAAVDGIHKGMTLAHHDEPTDSDWYVLGRVCELSGLRDDAIATYRRIPAPKTPDLLPEPYTLAAARLRILGAARK